ncbi:MAG: hypothetical protein AAF203_06915, partial [Pseudomonadota bacterium]
MNYSLVISIFFSLFIGGFAMADDYVDKEYEIPPHETPGIIKGSCRENYVPVHSRELLYRVREWAIGNAIHFFAPKAHYEFDFEAYDDDVPHRGLYNFGQATATECLEVDVLQYYMSAFDHLNRVYQKSRDPETKDQVNFEETFFGIAESYGFDQYLSKPQNSNGIVIPKNT